MLQKRSAFDNVEIQWIIEALLCTFRSFLQ